MAYEALVQLHTSSTGTGEGPAICFAAHLLKKGLGFRKISGAQAVIEIRNTNP